MKIGLLTSVYKRERTNIAFSLMVKRLTEKFPGLFYPVAILSDTNDAKAFWNCEMTYYFKRNYPLAEKMNFGFRQMRNKVSHVLYIDSDDLIDDSYLDELLKGENEDISRCRGVYFLCLESGSPFYGKARFVNNTYKDYGGTGVLYNARLLNKTGWTIYEGSENDKMAYNSFLYLGSRIENQNIFSLEETGSVLLDIKTIWNINRFSQFRNLGIDIEPETIINKFGLEERRYLNQLMRNGNGS